jgi:hypothetical protein
MQGTSVKEATQYFLQPSMGPWTLLTTFLFSINNRDAQSLLEDLCDETGCRVIRSPSNPVHSCSELLYIWGNFSVSAADGSKSIYTSAMGCNETIEIVDVVVNYFGPNLHIDPANPRIVNDSSARPSPFTSGYESQGQFDSTKKYELYLNLANITGLTTNLLDRFTTYLTTSPFAIPVADIGNPAAATKVADAIKLQHRILRAQEINTNWRSTDLFSNKTTAASSIDEPSRPNTNTRLYQATASLSHNRVIQGEAPTRVLQAVLGVILLTTIISIILAPKADVLPRSPTSIGSIAALVARGDVLECLSSHGMKPQSETPIFWLGWNRLANGPGDLYNYYGIRASNMQGQSLGYDRDQSGECN